jgi:hypothetical protein
MTPEQNKIRIREAIKAFETGNLKENTLRLFNSLGYNTSRQAPLDKQTFAEFKSNYISPEKKFDEKKAFTAKWKYVDILFQLSAEEMQQQESLFKPTVEREDPASFLFMVIELDKNEYSRFELSQIVREVNKLFPTYVRIRYLQ